MASFSDDDNWENSDEGPIDCDEDNEEGQDAPIISFTNILFGNINDNGELEDDEFLDQETRKSLRSLEKLGITSSLIDELKDDVNANEESNQMDTSDNSEEKQQASSTKDANSEDGAVEKSETDNKNIDNNKLPSAIDYSDIDEMVEDSVEPENDSQEDIMHLPFKMPTAPVKGAVEQKTDDDKEDLDYDSSSDERDAEPKSSNEPYKTSVGSPNASTDSNLSAKKRLDTPLAAMLPSKYENCDVTDIFPEFRHNKVLRFLRLFGLNKPSNVSAYLKDPKVSKKKKKALLQHLAAQNEKEAKDIETAGEAKESDSNDKENEEKEFNLNIATSVDPSMLAEDDEERLLRPISPRDHSRHDDNSGLDQGKPKISDWRHGPAKLWYDMLGVPEDAIDLDNYGSDSRRNDEVPKFDQQTSDPDDAFLMVTQHQWEDDVIWDGELVKTNLDDPRMYHKIRLAGWVPSGTSRTWADFLGQIKGTRLSSMLNIDVNTHPAFTKQNQRNSNGKIEMPDQNKDNTWFSLLPVENEELVYAKWEDNVIWDPEIQKAVTEPKILTLDPNDENIILGIPDDIDPNATRTKETQPIPLKEKKEHHLRKSRILLGKAGVIAEQEPESPPPPQDMKKDPFNISNDEFYNPKLTQDTALKPTVGGHLIQHSIPAVELRQPFFPTFMGPNKLRTFHRPPMKRFSHGNLADALPHGVVPLLKHMKKKAKQREQERLASGGGEMFFMRSPEDLSGKDGDLIMCEYSEEHPPLMMQVGMATLIKNYYKRKPGKDGGAPNFKYGELAYAHTSPFLGNLLPGQTLQALENNLFRAPIYEHSMPDTDFLIIRTRHNYFVRSIETIFTVGQELPLYEVPGPNSKKANNFIRDFLQVFIYRLFWKSGDNPRRIKMEDIKKAFPSHSESSIRKRLKLCADFKRTGNGLDSNWWVLKTDFRLPTEDEMRAMVSPEQCCAYYSMIAAEQRLKDAGYGEKSLFVADDENDEDLQLKMDDEVKAAPWNTTRAFIAAMKAKCLLQLNGVADPTGCGEGFSYIRIPNKPQTSKEDGVKEVTPKKTVTGTDADLRRLPLNQARNLLRKFGLPEDEIKKLSRWEVIDVVRTLSTEKAKAGSEQMSKFARGNRFSIAEHQERYKEECQRIFELQNRVLASYEILSTDEEESEEEDLEIEEMGKNIENIIENKKTSQQLSLEKEEEERKELHKLIMGEDSNPSEDARGRKKQKKDENEDSLGLPSTKGRLLKIYRTYRNPQGREYVRIETVRKPAVIEAYVRIRETKDPEYIKKFASTLDEQQKEELRREKRRAQEQLRRLKRNEEKSSGGRRSLNQEKNFFQDSYDGSDMMQSSSPKFKSNESARKKLKKEKFNPKLKCSACGEVGHMKTNRACPYYKNRDAYGSSSAMGPDDVMDDDEPTGLDESDLVKVDETRVVLSKTLIRHAEEERRKAMVLKIPKEAMKRRRRIGTSDHCDYLQRPEYRSANRRRTDPAVTFSTFLENLCLEMRAMPGTDLFWTPVNPRTVPDYFNIVKKPIDIQTIRKKVRDKEYQNRQQFLDDVKQMHENSALYNGKTSELTAAALRMVELCDKRFSEKEDKFASLEKAINPLLDNDQVAFSYILEKIADQLKTIPDSRDFHQPVKKTIKNYYDVIAKPMDLETLSNKARNHEYHSREEFLNNVELIYQNSVQYNGPDSPYSLKAAEILETAKQLIKAQEESLANYEKAIKETKEAAFDAADSESGGLSNQANDETNDSLPDTRPQSVAAMNIRDEGNDRMLEYFDESSRSSFTASIKKKMMQRQMSPDHETDDNAQSMQVVNIALPTADIETPEEMVDENYDPSEFLLEKFSKRPSPPPPATATLSEERSISGSSKEAQQSESMQEDERNEDDGDIWF